jgi:PKD repeat protein
LHTYSKAGGYRVTLVASSSGCVATLEKNANQFAKPKASFTKSGTCNLEDIMFTNKSTIALGNTGYKWNFNDGGISNLENPSHVFNTPGSKTVKLYAISEFGCVDSTQLSFTLNESPMADFNYSDPCNLTATKFTRTGTIPSGTSSIYEWDFSGEGVSTNENPSYKFAAQGLKNVTLVVRSANGCADAITQTFNVKLQAKADFTGKDVCEGEAVAFTNKSSVAQGELVYEWRFGNGNTSQKTSPKYDYGISGQTKTFLVTLVANVPGGCSDSITRPVTINAMSNPNFTINRQGRTIVCTPADNDPIIIRNWRFGEGSRSTDLAPVHTYSNVDKGTFQVCLGVINTAGCLSESCKEVTIDLTSVQDVQNSNINVYPNPSNGRFVVSLSHPQPGLQIAVYNLLGELVYQLNPVQAANQYQLDMSQYANGVYVVQVKNGGNTSSQKITLTK